MREILFRGKGNPDLNEGSWYYGYLRQDKDGDYQICGDCWARTVILETIGQYTGLKDKNGTKIFEGDIVECDGILSVVEWDYSEWVHIDYNGWKGVFDAYTAENMAVVGNTSDNPTQESVKGE